MKKSNLKKAIRAYILKEINRKELENVIMERLNQFTRESEERKNMVFERWFRNAFDGIEENYRNYYWRHKEEDENNSLLDLLVNDGYAYLSKRYRQRYSKFN